MKIYPDHIAFIMDGNCRWAKKYKYSTLDSYRCGLEIALDMVSYGIKLNIRNITLFALSSENWKRPFGEVKCLLKLIEQYIIHLSVILFKKKACFLSIGSIEKFSINLQREISKLCIKTALNRKIKITIALSYGSHEEIINAFKLILSKIRAKTYAITMISNSLIEKFLYTHKTPAPDLLIRSSGEKRLSNFLLWQLAYAELYTTSTLWPDFKRDTLNLAISNYQSRRRRYGRLSRT
ncbi:MAG: di-trans,poly-cis-decaprenylcistransferase [Deltaproteobacteria bacterium]|nr:MAG: di-trans,poly-cis-decaprenylcistransferase [Deltaproteobacteria bacterium]